MSPRAFCLSVLLSLSGCQKEDNFHGISGPAWKQLSAEQKQMIIDQSYQATMNPLLPKNHSQG